MANPALNLDSKPNKQWMCTEVTKPTHAHLSRPGSKATGLNSGAQNETASHNEDDNDLRDVDRRMLADVLITALLYNAQDPYPKRDFGDGR